MTVIEIKHAAKRQEWIMECRGSGESVQRWCKEHQVSATTYYRQEREIFGQITKKEKESRLLAVAGPEFVPVLAITPCSTSANNDSAEWNGISRHLCGNWRQRVSGRVPCVEATMAFQGILPWLVAGTTPDKNLTRHEVLAKRKGKRTVLRRRVWLIVIFSSK